MPIETYYSTCFAIYRLFSLSKKNKQEKPFSTGLIYALSSKPAERSRKFGKKGIKCGGLLSCLLLAGLAKGLRGDGMSDACRL